MEERHLLSVFDEGGLQPIGKSGVGSLSDGGSVARFCFGSITWCFCNGV